MSAPTPVAIFDFDGTLADSLDLALDAYNRVAPRLRAKPIDRADLPRLRALPPREAMAEYDVSPWKLPLLVAGVRSAMRAHVDRLEPFAGVGEALRALVRAGCRCSVLSTNSTENITRFLARHDLARFEHVAGGVGMFGKARALDRLMRRAGYERARVFYVGDEARDVEAASAAGVRSVAVSWGYAGRDALAACAPTHLVDRPEDLVGLLAPRP